MRRFFLAAIVPLFLLTACATPDGSGPPIQITRTQVAESAQVAATALDTLAADSPTEVHLRWAAWKSAVVISSRCLRPNAGTSRSRKMVSYPA